MATVKQVDKIYSKRTDYNRQLCEYCGHSLIFNPKEEYKICSWCKNKNMNETRGAFMYHMYQLMEKDYKQIKIGDKNGKEK